MNENPPFNFLKLDAINQLQKDEFYNFSVTDLEADLKIWTDNLKEARAAARSVKLALIWDTNTKEEVQ